MESELDRLKEIISRAIERNPNHIGELRAMRAKIKDCVVHGNCVIYVSRSGGNTRLIDLFREKSGVCIVYQNKMIRKIGNKTVNSKIDKDRNKLIDYAISLLIGE